MSREVYVGKVGVGGDHPIRIQSMTTTKTDDVLATLDQIMRLADHGCEIVRVTVQGKKEANACSHIKDLLLSKGYDIPLVADIHFYPPAAMLVAESVDKVRINPGNFVDRRATFTTCEEDASEKIEAVFGPLVDKCKRLKRAMRIGANHGSLSDRIMTRYGATPRGMVESVIEFAEVARAREYHDLIFSMKASNPLVMIGAYRLLFERFEKLGWDYPMHLGVTEAGSGIDGRVKSAVGIGTLLLDGIGDTIRVSLTEDPTEEIAPAKDLASLVPAKVARPPKRPLKKGVIGGSGEILTLKEPLIDSGRRFFKKMHEKGENTPLLLKADDTSVMRLSAHLGSLLLDGYAQGVVLEKNLEESLLQAVRMHITKTDFIACPGCGRTLFDLHEVTKRIKAKTAHLPGVKIAIMGCIVNGPGEMADADFGFVGSGIGKVDLYVGHERVQKGIPHEEADERLIDLIKSHGMWKDCVSTYSIY